MLMVWGGRQADAHAGSRATSQEAPGDNPQDRPVSRSFCAAGDGILQSGSSKQRKCAHPPSSQVMKEAPYTVVAYLAKVRACRSTCGSTCLCLPAGDTSARKVSSQGDENHAGGSAWSRERSRRSRASRQQHHQRLLAARRSMTVKAMK